MAYEYLVLRPNMADQCVFVSYLSQYRNRSVMEEIPISEWCAKLNLATKPRKGPDSPKTADDSS